MRRRGLTAATTTAILAALMLIASANAFGAAQWRITSQHGPTNIAPGGEGQYALIIQNVGTSDANGDTDEDSVIDDPITLTDTLPEGLVATGVVATPDLDTGAQWDCSATPFFPTPSGGTVTCELPDVIPAPSQGPGTPLIHRGVGHALYIDVTADPSPPLNGNNEATISGGGAIGPASTTDPTTFSSTPAGFGLNRLIADAFDAASPGGSPVIQAGAHPFESRFDLSFNLKTTNDPEVGFFTEPDQRVKRVDTELPLGFVGNPEAAPKCPQELMSVLAPGTGGGFTLCPAATQVGTIDLITQAGNTLLGADKPNITQSLPVYNVEPQKGAVAELDFAVQTAITHIVSRLDPANHYAIKTTVDDTPTLVPIRSADLTLWGVPADAAHDKFRFHPTGNGLPSDNYYGIPANQSPKPFLTLPSQCDTPGQTTMTVSSWTHPESPVTEQSPPVTQTGCEKQDFEASIKAQPTSREAGAPTGLAVDVNVPQDLKVPGLGTPPLKKTVVRLPEGMAVSPSSADGLAGCSPAQISLGTDQQPSCPDASKIGTVQLTTPLLPDPVGGDLYLAKPFDNPSNSLIALYIVIEDPVRGLLVKLPGVVSADPQSGRLTTTFEDTPQIPFSSLHVQLKSGPRAPLVNSGACGTMSTEAEFTSWNSSLAVVQSKDSFSLSGDGNGSSCPAKQFKPSLSAGTKDPVSGAFSPLALRLQRSDRDGEFGSLPSLSLPPGLIASLKGTSYCSEAALGAANSDLNPAHTGTQEASAPSCPASSLIGTATVGAGPGTNPFYTERGHVYLAGPYKGAPLSIAVIVPALAGPFDLGDQVVRSAVYVDPSTAQLHAVSDPFPSILQGIPLKLRDIRIDLNREDFTLNPTNCEPMSVKATVASKEGKSADLSDRFQVGNCERLAFKPKLSFKLKGGTTRGKHPSFSATLRMPKGGANIARAQVTLPHSEFLDQAHIKTVCTRVQFAADNCPKGSIYGFARAITPLLDKPLEGPVYLRSSNHNLPDLIADLNGQIHVVLDGRIDSIHGQIRNTFDLVPDAPVSKFTLSMQGGKKGLLQNSRNLCLKAARVGVELDAQNGRVRELRPVLGVGCGPRRIPSASK